MGQDQSDQALTRRWAEYQSLLQDGAAYSAMVRLGEIANSLQSVSSSGLVEKWHGILTGVELSDELVLAVLAEARNQVNRVARMLGVGSNFTYEELMLAITVRTELDLLLEFLRGRGIQLELDLCQLDSDIVEVAGATHNSRAFQSAQAAAKRNWGLPVKSRWLESVGPTR